MAQQETFVLLNLKLCTRQVLSSDRINIRRYVTGSSGLPLAARRASSRTHSNSTPSSSRYRFLLMLLALGPYTYGLCISVV